MTNIRYAHTYHNSFLFRLCSLVSHAPELHLNPSDYKTFRESIYFSGSRKTSVRQRAAAAGGVMGASLEPTSIYSTVTVSVMLSVD